MFERLALWYKKPTQDVVDEASLLIKSQAFRIAFEEIQNRILNELVATKPEDTAKRETLYHKYTATEEVLQELATLASTSLDQPGTESDQGEI